MDMLDGSWLKMSNKSQMAENLVYFNSSENRFYYFDLQSFENKVCYANLATKFLRKSKKYHMKLDAFKLLQASS